MLRRDQGYRGALSMRRAKRRESCGGRRRWPRWSACTDLAEPMDCQFSGARMAEEDTGQEKTEEATPRRLERAREEGQVARSRELSTHAGVGPARDRPRCLALRPPRHPGPRCDAVAAGLGQRGGAVDAGAGVHPPAARRRARPRGARWLGLQHERAGTEVRAAGSGAGPAADVLGALPRRVAQGDRQGAAGGGDHGAAAVDAARRARGHGDAVRSTMP